MKSGWLSFVVSLPVIALFGGAGVMAYFIGQTWSTRHNDMAIVALSVSCLGVVVVVSVAVLLFMMYAYRLRQIRHETPIETPMINVTSSPRPPAWAEQPPMLTDKNVGSWETTGQGYDLWEERERTRDEMIEQDSKR